MMQQGNRRRDGDAASCNVSSRFNFAMGAVAIVAAVAIAYSIWRLLW